MSDDAAIRAEGLGKKYQIGHAADQERYIALRDVLARGARGVLRRTADMLHGRAVVSGDTVEEFWALRDVSFEVRRGEVLGIIGRNGAGKSTLLKILSRITEPSEGRVTITGRVASLLEVGTGFHPELTGRENIFLNGAILGMTRAEIRRKFDEIVAFAEVERFLDTPVKRYSSGMYVRLAFAVAAHLEPEILVVDEVLAVGDAEFQNKCLGKMDQVTRRDGRTVLFVSHNMAAITRLCVRAIWLEAGRIIKAGAAQHLVSDFLGAHRNGLGPPRFARRNTGDALRVESVQLLVDGIPATFRQGGPILPDPHWLCFDRRSARSDLVLDPSLCQWRKTRQSMDQLRPRIFPGLGRATPRRTDMRHSKMAVSPQYFSRRCILASRTRNPGLD